MGWNHPERHLFFSSTQGGPLKTMYVYGNFGGLTSHGPAEFPGLEFPGFESEDSTSDLFSTGFCFHEDTLVEGIRIAELMVGDIVETTEGQRTIQGKSRATGFGKQQFVVIPKGAIGRVSPSEDLKVTPGHVFRIAGCNILAQQFVGKVPGVYCVDLPAVSYHLVFENHDAIEVSGMVHTTVHPQEYDRIEGFVTPTADQRSLEELLEV